MGFSCPDRRRQQARIEAFSILISLEALVGFWQNPTVFSSFFLKPSPSRLFVDGRCVWQLANYGCPKIATGATQSGNDDETDDDDDS